MSYILDALVKADLERQRQEVPGLHTVQGSLLPRESSYLGWLLGAAGLALAAALLFLAWGRLGQRPTAALPAELESRRPESLQLTKQLAVTVPPAEVTIQAAPPGATTPPPVSAREATAGNRIEAPAEERKSRPDSRLYGVAELPPVLQKEARSIRISGFAQASDAGEPMAIINDRAWREGEELAPGLKVERISNDGVIFNLKGYRFRKGAA